MSDKRRILLIATGGTIASQISEHGLKPGLDAEQILSYIPELREDESFYPGVSDQPPIGKLLRDSGAVIGWDPEGGE